MPQRVEWLLFCRKRYTFLSDQVGFRLSTFRTHEQ